MKEIMDLIESGVSAIRSHSNDCLSSNNRSLLSQAQNGIKTKPSSFLNSLVSVIESPLLNLLQNQKTKN